MRIEEKVRPIFWANKPKSYIARTQDEFTNGRWGLSRSPAFGNEDDYPSMSKVNRNPIEKRLKMWGELTEELDMGKLILKYISGKVKRLPWSESSVADETSEISDLMKLLNNNYFFTTNSQPAVNGVSSTDPVHGWGPPKGYIYQKSYIEFLIPETKLKDFLEHLKQYDTVSYQAMNIKGESFSNVSNVDVNAVTWGVFPAQEIMQPTVVDHQSFELWVKEFFGTITQEWMGTYEEGSESQKVLQNIHDNYFLMNVVENDYISGNLNIFEDFIKD